MNPLRGFKGYDAQNRPGGLSGRRTTRKARGPARLTDSTCLILLGLDDFVLEHINQRLEAVALKDGTIFHAF